MDRLQRLKEAIEDAEACVADARLTSATRRGCRDEVEFLRQMLVEEECRVERAFGMAEGKPLKKKQGKEKQD